MSEINGAVLPRIALGPQHAITPHFSIPAPGSLKSPFGVATACRTEPSGAAVTLFTQHLLLLLPFARSLA